MCDSSHLTIYTCTNHSPHLTYLCIFILYLCVSLEVGEERITLQPKALKDAPVQELVQVCIVCSAPIREGLIMSHTDYSIHHHFVSRFKCVTMSLLVCILTVWSLL